MKPETLAMDASSVRSKDDNGNLRVAVSHLTKVQVAPYYGYEIPDWEKLGLDEKKIYYGYRSAEELSKPETIDSVNLIPIQLQHHPDYPDDPAKSTRIGTTGESAAFNAPYLDNSLCFTDELAIEHIQDGSMRELSLGYRYIPDFTPGTTPEGEKYDFVMRHISANHVALVEQGRAGRDVLVEDHALNEGKNMDKKKTAMAHDSDPSVNDPAANPQGSNAAPAASSAPAAGTPPAVTPEKPPVAGDDFDPVAALQQAGFNEEQIAKIKAAFAAAAQDAQPPAAADADPVPPKNEETKSEPEKKDEANDSDPAPEEKKNEPEAKDEKACPAQDTKLAQDAALKKSFDSGVAEGRKAAMEIFSAVEEVKPVLGACKAMSYDSAGAVYLDALKALGMPVENIAPESARLMFTAYQAGAKKAQPTMAEDSAPERDGLADVLAQNSH